jgi:hypothetical protein
VAHRTTPHRSLLRRRRPFRSGFAFALSCHPERGAFRPDGAAQVQDRAPRVDAKSSPGDQASSLGERPRSGRKMSDLLFALFCVSVNAKNNKEGFATRLFLASRPNKRLHFGVPLPACSLHAELAGLDYHKKTKCGKERCMQKNNDNRVLGRRKARHLSPEELEELMGTGFVRTLHMTSIVTPDE